jgi:hypothetical protein
LHKEKERLLVNMKTKALILLLIVVLSISAMGVAVAEPTVDVAVYFESSNISESEKSNVLSVLEVVNQRFVEQLGVGVNFEVVGSWESNKNIVDDMELLDEAVSETDGIWTRLIDNIGYFAWKFYHPPHIVGVYFIDQPMQGEGKDIAGSANAWIRACIIRYYDSTDKLAGIVQHELSHLFGIYEHCSEEWCVMNYAYMPYRISLLWWVIYEDYADTWGPICRQVLIECYNGKTRTYSLVITFQGYECYYEYTYFIFKESYNQWNLTSNRLVSVVHVKRNLNIKNSVHAVIASAASVK